MNSDNEPNVTTVTCPDCDGIIIEGVSCPVCSQRGLTTNHPVKDGQAKVEDFPPEQRYSFANNGTTYPQYCLGGQEHEWKRIRDPFGPANTAGLREDKCELCGWVHGNDSSG